jgi:hypothetical protein
MSGTSVGTRPNEVPDEAPIEVYGGWLLIFTASGVESIETVMVWTASSENVLGGKCAVHKMEPAVSVDVVPFGSTQLQRNAIWTNAAAENSAL